MSDLGNKHNNGPRQDQIFDKPLLSAWHCGPKIGFGSGDAGGVGVGGGLMHPIGSLQREYDFLSLRFCAFLCFYFLFFILLFFRVLLSRQMYPV